MGRKYYKPSSGGPGEVEGVELPASVEEVEGNGDGELPEAIPVAEVVPLAEVVAEDALPGQPVEPVQPPTEPAVLDAPPGPGGPAWTCHPVVHSHGTHGDRWRVELALTLERPADGAIPLGYVRTLGFDHVQVALAKAESELPSVARRDALAQQWRAAIRNKNTAARALQRLALDREEAEAGDPPPLDLGARLVAIDQQVETVQLELAQARAEADKIDPVYSKASAAARHDLREVEDAAYGEAVRAIQQAEAQARAELQALALAALQPALDRLAALQLVLKALADANRLRDGETPNLYLAMPRPPKGIAGTLVPEAQR